MRESAETMTKRISLLYEGTEVIDAVSGTETKRVREQSDVRQINHLEHSILLGDLVQINLTLHVQRRVMRGKSMCYLRS